jgi:hypothetical protein
MAMMTANEVGAAMIACPPQEMDKEVGTSFAYLFIMERQKAPVPDEIKSSFIFQVMRKRADVCGVNVSDHVLTFISTLIRAPGAAVMYVAACKRIMDLNGGAL